MIFDTWITKGPCIYLVKKVSCKNQLSNWRKIGEFCPRVAHAGFQKPATLNGFTLTLDQKSPLGEGEMAWVANLDPPPPHIHEFFFFASFSLVIWHMGCFLHAKCPSQDTGKFYQKQDLKKNIKCKKLYVLIRIFIQLHVFEIRSFYPSYDG